MLAIFISISQTLVSSGFGEALIQKKIASQSDYYTVFYFSIVIGLLLYTLLYFIAPFIANFYGKSQLTALTRFLGLSIIISSFSHIQNILLFKNIDFKTRTKVSLISILLSSSIAVILAMNGFDVWSLAVQIVSMYFFSAFLLWFFNNWRPTLEFSKKSFESLFSFGSKLLVSSLLNTIFENIYPAVIGKAFAAKQVGFYTQAARLRNIPTRNLNRIFQGVTFPVFLKIRDEDIRLKRGYKNVLKGLVFINFPLMLGLIAIANPLIRLLLTDK